MSNLPTIITFPSSAEHSETFLLSRYRTAVEIALVSGSQICRFIPNHCKPHTHASHMQIAHCYAKQVSGSFWGALFVISLIAMGLWCTGLELPTAPIAACCLNEFYISKQMKHSTKWKEIRMLPRIRMCCAFCEKDCGYQCAVTNLDKVPLYNTYVLKSFELVKFSCRTAAELSLQIHMLPTHT